ncbi:MAG: Crp/Fnr family transcriptional regulator [Fimbriimonadaceae bacterium]
MATNAEILARVPLFEGVGPESLETLGAACSRRSLAKEEVLFLEGEAGNAMFVVVSGRLRIERIGATGDSQTLGYRTGGDVVGEMALLDGSPRSAQATAASDCRLLVFLADEFERTVLAQPGVGLAVMRTLAKRLREAAQRAIDVRTKDVPERLLDLLRASADGSGFADLGLSQGAIADLLGCTRESVNRAFAELEAAGEIERVGSRKARLT